MSNRPPASFAASPDWPALPEGPAAAELWVPLSSRSAPLMARPRAAGSRVRAGEILTESAQQASHSAIAPADGRIGSVGQVWLLNGQRVWAVQVFPDARESNEGSAGQGPSSAASPPTEASDWIDRLRHGGIWADRVSSPDLIAQLHQSLRRPIDTVVCNLLDSDRELPINEMLSRQSPQALIEGVLLLARIAGASRIVLAAPTGRAASLAALAPPAKRLGLRIVTLPNEYPLADPTMLLYRLFKRRLRPRRLPVEQGVLLFDATAAIAAGQFALNGQPMLSVPLALHDHVRDRSHAIRVPVGTPLSWILTQLQCAAGAGGGGGGAEQEDMELRGGALLRDLRLNGELRLNGDPPRPPADLIVVAGSELTVHVSLPSRAVNPDPCIRCSWCVEACPTRIHPAGLLEASQRADLVLAERYGIEACIECGVCSYVCPSHLPILAGIRRLGNGAAKGGRPS